MIFTTPVLGETGRVIFKHKSGRYLIVSGAMALKIDRSKKLCFQFEKFEDEICCRVSNTNKDRATAIVSAKFRELDFFGKTFVVRQADPIDWVNEENAKENILENEVVSGSEPGFAQGSSKDSKDAKKNSDQNEGIDSNIDYRSLLSKMKEIKKNRRSQLDSKKLEGGKNKVFEYGELGDSKKKDDSGKSTDAKDKTIESKDSAESTNLNDLKNSEMKMSSQSKKAGETTVNDKSGARQTDRKKNDTVEKRNILSELDPKEIKGILVSASSDQRPKIEKYQLDHLVSKESVQSPASAGKRITTKSDIQWWLRRSMDWMGVVILPSKDLIPASGEGLESVLASVLDEQFNAFEAGIPPVDEGNELEDFQKFLYRKSLEAQIFPRKLRISVE